MPQVSSMGREVTLAMGLDYSALKATTWGYSIRSSRSYTALQMHLAELGLMAIGMGLIVCSVGLWAFGGLAASAAVLGMKFALTLAMLVAALALLELARRGLSREVQFDQSRDEVRVIWRNRRGHLQLDTVYAFSEISSMFVRRRKMPMDLAYLYMRCGDAGEVIEVASGAEGSVRALWEKINADMARSMPERVAAPSSAKKAGRRKLGRHFTQTPRAQGSQTGMPRQQMRRRNAVSSATSRLI